MIYIFYVGHKLKKSNTQNKNNITCTESGKI